MAYMQENLSQKTVVGKTPEEIDEKCETFRQKQTIRFTQSNQIIHNGELVFVNTLFYLPKKDNDTNPTLDNPVRTPKPVETPKEELWTDCTCGLRWKYSHYSRCKCGNNTPPEEVKDSYNKIWGV